MALRANRPTTNQAPAFQEEVQAIQEVAPVVNATNTVATRPMQSGQMQNLNAGILDNIDSIGNAGNYVSMDGSQFLYKASEVYVPNIDLVVNYGKRYYQWVEEDGEAKIFHNSDTKLDDRYKLKFEVHWNEEDEEGTTTECQFHMPTASAMRFIDYVKALSQAGFGVGQVVTRLTVSRQQQKGTTNRFSRAEFTMVGVVEANGEWTEVPNGISTVNRK